MMRILEKSITSKQHTRGVIQIFNASTWKHIQITTALSIALEPGKV